MRCKFGCVLLTFVSLIGISYLAVTESTYVDIFAASASPAPTESPGGVIGTYVDELRCPVNLTGRGPTWKTITIGISTLQDLEDLYRQEGIQVTPFPIYAGDYAPNYEFTSRTSTGRWDQIQACIVEGRVAALLVFRIYDPAMPLPQVVEQWVSLLGRPDVISWHESPVHRILHWPRQGISITAETIGGGVDWVYYYPFRGDNYEELWPINSIWSVPPFSEGATQVELEAFDFGAIELTITANPHSWPTRTPDPALIPTLTQTVAAD